MTRRIEALWNSYRENVLPAECSEIQITETRRAFYAGVKGFLGYLLTVLDPAADPTEEDLWIMEEIERELKEFAEHVGEGQA